MSKYQQASYERKCWIIRQASGIWKNLLEKQEITGQSDPQAT